MNVKAYIAFKPCAGFFGISKQLSVTDDSMKGFRNESSVDNKESIKNGKCHGNESVAATSPVLTVHTSVFGFPLWKTTDS